MTEAYARTRIALGRAWFRSRGWPLQGFVAPAWLLSSGAWQALADAPPCFLYTTTLARFHWLAPAQALWAPSLVYAARNGAGRMLSPRALDVALALQWRAPLVRLSLHPRDARHPALMRHMQRLLAHLLARRQAVTKARFAYQYGPQKPPPRQRPGP